jgi:hypothetical protein
MSVFLAFGARHPKATLKKKKKRKQHSGILDDGKQAER